MTGAAAPALPLLAAAAELEHKPLIVSIHDVAPPTRSAVERILSELARNRVSVTSLLVVPDYHHTGASMSDRGFTQWLRDLENAGHEVVIHGYYHERPQRAGAGLVERLLTGSYTADEGEFYDLPYEEALHRVTSARDQFRAAGLTPRGFIAPAWLLGAAAEQALRDAEMEYTTRLTGVRDLRTGVQTRARSLVYSTRSAWRRALSRVWNGSLARMSSQWPLLRLAIHPADVEHAGIWRQAIGLARRFAASRAATTYCDWIAEQRATGVASS